MLGLPEMDELKKKEEMENKKSPSASGGIIFPGQRMPMQLPERENSFFIFFLKS